MFANWRTFFMYRNKSEKIIEISKIHETIRIGSTYICSKAIT
jgi:hypothetical protein